MNFWLSFTIATLPFSTSMAEIGVIASILLWAWKKISAKEPVSLPAVVGVSYLLFFLAVVLSLWQAEPSLRGTALRGVWKWSRALLFFMVCHDAFSDPAVARRNLWIFLGSMLVLTLNGFYQMIHGIDWIKGYSVDIPGRLARMKSSLKSPNDLAAFYLFAVPLAFSSWLERKTWSKKSAGLVTLTALFFTAFILTFSRAAFLCLALAALIRLAGGRQKKSAAILLLSVGLLFLSPMLRHNFFTGFLKPDKTVSERMRYWSVTWEMIRHKPFTGHGVNTFTQTFGRYAPPGETYRGYAHNCYLQLWSEIGIFGLIAFLVPLVWALGVPWFAGGRNDPFNFIESALWIGLAAYLGQSFLDTHFYSLQTGLLFWFFFGFYLEIRQRTDSSVQKRGE